MRSLARPLILGLLLALSLTAPARAQGEPADMMQGYLAAGAALAAGDTAAALDALLAAERLVPASPFVVGDLAILLAARGDSAGARLRVGRLRALGAEAELGARARLRALVPTPPAAAPAPDTVLLLPDPDLIPEGIARDPRDGALYVGSYGGAGILRVVAGEATPWARPDPASVGSVLGVRVDAARNALWAAAWVRDSAAAPASDGARGFARLVRFDLATGRASQVIPLPDRAGPHLLNDLVVTREGTVYLTDSEGGAIWRLPSGADSLELVFGGGPRFGYPNGIALSAGEDTLFVAHTEGVSARELATGRQWEMAGAPDAWAGLIDGLLPCGDDLIGVQRLGATQRLVRLRREDGRIVAALTAHAIDPVAGIATTAALLPDGVHLLANTQIDRVRPDGTMAPSAEGRRSLILRAPVDCGRIG